MTIIKKINFAAVMILTTSLIFAQKVVDVPKADMQNGEPTIMFTPPSEGIQKFIPEIQPEFKGGQAEMNVFISRNLKYPKNAVKNNVQGLLVVQLDIAKDDTARFGKFIKTLGYGCEEEVKRLISKMPKWKPAVLHGKPADSDYIMRVTFKLTE